MNNYVLVIPHPIPQPTTDETCVTPFASREELAVMLNDMDKNDWLALDLETAGLYPRYHREWHEQSFGAGQYIVVVGLYQPAIGAVAIDVTNSYAGCLDDLITHLVNTQQPLVGYNFYFDLLSLAGRNARVGPPTDDWHRLNHVDDGLWRFKLLATEGWEEQKHGLKVAQVDILEWSSRGDAALTSWLTANGYKKHDMYAAPIEILGHYCALDAFSTYHITKHLKSICDRWPAFELFTKAFLAEVRCLIQNYYAGIPVDVEAMTKFMHAQEEPIAASHKAITSHPDVAPILARDLPLWLADKHPEPKRFKDQRTPGEEPPKYTKAGHVSKRWQLWNEKIQNVPEPEETKQWKDWRKRMANVEMELERYGAPLDLFSPNSSQKVDALMYSDLKYPCIATKRDKKTGEEKRTSGKDAYPGWGELGHLFSTYKGAVQKRNMARSWLQNTDPETQRLYPLFKVPGTTTTRLAGSGGVNVQNPVKDKGFLDCIREDNPDEWVWIDADIFSAEPVIMAYVTKDPGYLNIYGPTAKPNDIYVFFMAHVPAMSALTAACGYDPYNPTKEALDKVKHEHKTMRGVAKTAVLSLGYGSGKKKLHQSFIIKGIKMNGKLITREESDKIYDTYWKAFPGIKKYGDWCTACWERTGGYVISPVGTPVSACDNKLRKVPNHNIQLTGHLFTMLWIMYTEQLLDESGIEWQPVIMDFHDQITVRVKYKTLGLETTVAKVKEIYCKAMDRANKDLELTNEDGSGIIWMKVTPSHGFNLTAFKIES